MRLISYKVKINLYWSQYKKGIRARRRSAKSWHCLYIFDKFLEQKIERRKPGQVLHWTDLSYLFGGVCCVVLYKTCHQHPCCILTPWLDYLIDIWMETLYIQTWWCTVYMSSFRSALDFEISELVISVHSLDFHNRFLCCLLLLRWWWLACSWWQQLLINGWWLPSIQFFIPAKVNCSACRLDNFWTIRVRTRNSWSGWRQWLPLLGRRHNIKPVKIWWWQRWYQGAVAAHQWLPQSWPSSLCCWCRLPPPAPTLKGLELGLSHGPSSSIQE